MRSLRIYDPVQGCAAGLCGPEMNETLERFAADLDWLRQQGVQVQRFNLGHDPGAFAGNPLVKGVIREQGMSGLPAVLVEETVVATGRHPDLAELCVLLDLRPPEAGTA